MRKITNLEDLRLERAGIKAEIAHKEQEIKMMGQYVKSFYTPGNIVSVVLGKFAPLIESMGIIVELYDRVMDAIERRKARRAGAKKESAPVAEAPEADIDIE